MLVEVIAVVEGENAEIGRIAKDPADLESRRGGRVQRGGGAEIAEPAELDGPIRLQFVDTFWHVSPFPTSEYTAHLSRPPQPIGGFRA